MRKIIEKYKKLSVRTKAVFWFTGCNFLQKGISFITVPIFTRMMSTEEYGMYTLYTSWYQILLIFTSLYLFNGVYDNAMAKFSDDRDSFTSSMQGLSLTVSVIVGIFYLLTRDCWEGILGLPEKYVMLMFIEMAVAPAIYFWSGRQRFEYQYKRLVFITVLKSLINPMLGLLLISESTDKAFSRIVSIVIVELLFDGTIMIYQFIKGKQYYNKKYWKYGITLAIPLIPHYLAGMILNQGDRIVIDRIVGKSAVAMYGVAYSIGMLIQIFANAINSSITPWLYEALKDRRLNEIKIKVNGLLLIVAGLIIGLVFVSPELVIMFGSTKYMGAMDVIPPIAASVYFIFLYGVLSFPEFYYEKTRFLALASFGAAVINIILNIIFVKMFGFVAAGYTTLICYIMYSIGHYYVGKKVLNQKIPNSSIINEYFVICLSIGMLVMSILGNILNKYFYIRYGLIIVLLFAFWINRKNLIALLNK